MTTMPLPASAAQFHSSLRKQVSCVEPSADCDMQALFQVKYALLRMVGSSFYMHIQPVQVQRIALLLRPGVRMH